MSELLLFLSDKFIFSVDSNDEHFWLKCFHAWDKNTRPIPGVKTSQPKMYSSASLRKTVQMMKQILVDWYIFSNSLHSLPENKMSNDLSAFVKNTL